MSAMRVRRRLGLAAAVCLAAVLLLACTSDDESGDGDAPGDPGDPGGAEEESAAQGEGAPFNVDIHRIRLVGAGNAEIRGTDSTPTDHDAAQQAVEAARKRLEIFLNAQFVDEETRFSEQPLGPLLTPRAEESLTDADRAGLGVIATPVARTFTGSASAVAQVVLEGSNTHLVHLWYATTLRAELEDGTTTPVDQRGSLTFLPTDEGWRAEAVEVDLKLPEAPEPDSEDSS